MTDIKENTSGQGQSTDRKILSIYDDEVDNREYIDKICKSHSIKMEQTIRSQIKDKPKRMPNFIYNYLIRLLFSVEISQGKITFETPKL